MLPVQKIVHPASTDKAGRGRQAVHNKIIFSLSLSLSLSLFSLSKIFMKKKRWRVRGGSG